MKGFTHGLLVLSLVIPGVCSAKAFKGKFKCNGTIQTTINGMATTVPVRGAKMLSEIIPAGSQKQSMFAIDFAPLMDGIGGYVSEDRSFTGYLLYEHMKSMRWIQCASMTCNIFGYRSSVTGTSNAAGSQVRFNISDSWSQQKTGSPSESRSTNYILTCKK